MVLSAIDILVLSYADGLNAEKGLQQAFWRDQYGVSPNRILIDLRKKGYIMMSEDIEKLLTTYSGKELKEAAVKYGLAKSGTKAEISSRIVNNVPREEILNDFPAQIYSLTSMGKENLLENDYVVFVHKNGNYDSINLYDAENVKKEHPEFNGVQVISHLYDKAVSKAIKEKNYHNAMFQDLSHANFLSREGMNEFALRYIMRSIYVRLSGIDRVLYLDGQSYSTYLEGKRFVDNARIDSYVLIDLKKILMAIGMDSKGAVEYFEKNIASSTRLPVQILTDEEMKYILLLELTENYSEVEEFYLKISKRAPIVNKGKSSRNHKEPSNKRISSQKENVKKKSFFQKLLGK